MNILILSCGTRNKIVQYFKKELEGKGKVVATDCSELAPALYDADKYYITPKIDEPGYIDTILSICDEQNISGVFSLIDPELSLLSKHKEKFLEKGVQPIVSDYEHIELCLDKFKFYQYLQENNINTVKSYIDRDEFYKDLNEGKINFPVFIKPIKGSASINISKVDTIEEVEFMFSKHENLMIQEFMNGKEYGVDAYIDMMSGEVVSIFVKEKIKMRSGETDKSVSVIDDEITSLVNDLIQKLGFKGVIDIDIFEIEGEYYISEVNPRFGGGYPHAYECGVNIPSMIMNNSIQITNNQFFNSYKEDIKMLKFNEVTII